MLDSLGHWLLFWTLLVVVGLIVEYVQEILKLVRTKPFARGSIPVIVGGILITAGVAGELYIESRASKVENDLRIANDQTIAELKKEASDANDRAGVAEQRAAELLAEIQPRDLSIERQKAIGNDLRQFSGRFVLIWLYPMDLEGERLGRLMVAALGYGGISAHLSSEYGAFIPSTALATGVKVEGDDKAFVDELKKVLVSEGHLALAPDQEPVSNFRGGPRFVQQVPIAGPLPKTPSATLTIGVKPFQLAK